MGFVNPATVEAPYALQKPYKEEVIDDLLVKYTFDGWYLDFELTNKADDYGELFKIVWNIKLNRILEIRDYGVMVKADLSDLSEDEMIFIRESTTNPEEGMVFECDESGNEGYTYCSMTGFTYGKSTEEICEILNKVKLVMYMEDENGKITTRKFKASDATIDVKEETDEIEVRETREYYNLD